MSPAALLLASPVATLASAFRTLIGISGKLWPGLQRIWWLKKKAACYHRRPEVPY